jgi:hypothetical protein
VAPKALKDQEVYRDLKDRKDLRAHREIKGLKVRQVQ